MRRSPFTRPLAVALTAIALGTAAHADAVTDALTAAQTAYAAGDLAQTAAALTTATKALGTLQGERLAAFLPAAPDGWTLTASDVADEGMALLGMTGTTVEGQYAHSDGRSMTVTLTADSPMVASMAGMLGNPQMMAMMGDVLKVGTTDMVVQDGSISGLIGFRVLVQAQGDTVEGLTALLSTMDFAALPMFDA